MERGHIQMSDQEILSESLRLAELQAETYLSADRKADISRKLGYLTFEVMARNGNIRPMENILEVAYGTHTV